MENPAPKPLFGKIPEEAFDHVQPGCTGRCEVHMKGCNTSSKRSMDLVNDLYTQAHCIAADYVLAFGVMNLPSGTPLVLRSAFRISASSIARSAYV